MNWSWFEIICQAGQTMYKRNSHHWIKRHDSHVLRVDRDKEGCSTQPGEEKVNEGKWWVGDWVSQAKGEAENRRPKFKCPPKFVRWKAEIQPVSPQYITKVFVLKGLVLVIYCSSLILQERIKEAQVVQEAVQCHLVG